MSYTIRFRAAEDRGATLLETALVIPLFFALLLGIFEFARIILLKNILSTAVSRTASLAAVVPNLESYPTPGDAADTAQLEKLRADAINNLRAAAKQLPLSTLYSSPGADAMAVLVEVDPRSGDLTYPTSYPDGVTPKDTLEVILPEPSGGQSLKEAMRERPITLRMHARIYSILPFLGPYDVVSSTAIFREPKTYSSMPIALDCKGNRLRLGAEVKCPCEADPENPKLVYDYATGKCRCAGDLIGDVPNCNCPAGMTNIPGTADCNCTLTNADCQADYEVDPSTCSCKKSLCTAHQEQIPGTMSCRCAPQTCGIHESQDPVTCECIPCANLETRDGADPSKCTCEPTLAGPECAKAPDSYLDAASCTCKPCAAGKTMTKDYTGCICKTAATCTSDTQFTRDSTCECVTCKQGWVVNETSTACKCRGDYSYVSTFDGLCHCNLYDGVSKCAALGMRLNPITCSCEACPTNAQVAITGGGSASSCKCSTAVVNACVDSKGTVNPYTCECTKCPDPYLPDATGSKCECPNKNTCISKGLAIDNTTCQCTTCSGDPYYSYAANGVCGCWVWEEDDPWGACQSIGKHFDSNKCDCIACPSPQVAGYGGCACPSGTPTMAQCIDQGLALNSATCACEACPSPKVLGLRGCMCDPSGPSPAACGGNTFFNAATCQCEDCGSRYANSTHTACISCGKQCSGGDILDVATCTCIPCQAGMLPNASRTACICDPKTSQACYADWIYDISTCLCDYYPCHGYEEDTYSPLEPNADRSGCVCPPSIKANCTGANQIYDPVWCECSSCPYSRVPSPDHMSCICPPTAKDKCTGTNVYFDPADCGCKTCNNLKVAASDHLSCYCPDDARSKCSADQRFDPNNCGCVSCPLGQTANSDHSACVCKTAGATSCPEKYVYVPPSQGQECGTCQYCSWLSQPDATRSTCVCPDNPLLCDPYAKYVPGPYNPRVLSCGCSWCESGKKASDDRSACICDPGYASYCSPTQYYDAAPESCACKDCSGGLTGSRKLSTQDRSACYCPADAAATCADNQSFNQTDCRCVDCPPYYVPSSDKSSCVCSTASVAKTCTGNKVVNNISCACDISCVAPRTPSASKMECVCPPCPTDKPILNQSDCSCSAACTTGVITPSGACCNIGSIIINDRCADPRCAARQCSIDPASGTYTVSEE